MPSSYLRLLIVCLVIAVVASISASGQPSSQPATTIDAVTGFQPLRDGVEIQAGSATLRITALRDDIIRVRISPGALPEDASWAVLPAARTKSIDVQPVQDDASVGFHTGALDVRVERNPLRLVIRDLAGNVISADAPGRPVRFQLVGFTISKQMPGGENYFGLGDKAGSFNRRNQAFTLWNTDIGPQ